MIMPIPPEELEQLRQLHETALDSNKLILLFKGAISQNTLIRIGGLLHLTYEETHQDYAKKRLFSVLVEMAQNILHYSQEREFFPKSRSVVGAGSLLVKESPEAFEIESSNLVTSEQKAQLESLCALINSMSEEKLREFYLAQRKQASRPPSKGAGLGLIEIARKAKSPVVAHFTEGPNALYHYTLSTRISRDCSRN